MSDKKISSTEKLATRSDYERGKLDGLAEAVALLNERGAEQLKRLIETKYMDSKSPNYDPKVKTFYDLPLEERDRIDGWYKSAKALWVIYRRRAI